MLPKPIIPNLRITDNLVVDKKTIIENEVAIVIIILFITQNFPLERIINQSIKAIKSRKLADKPIIPSAILAPIF